jgi:hypothetical protein
MLPTKIDSHNSKTAKSEADLSPGAAAEETEGHPQARTTLNVAGVEKTITKLMIALPKTKLVKSVRRWAITQTCAKVDINALTGLKSATSQS